MRLPVTGVLFRTGAGRADSDGPARGYLGCAQKQRHAALHFQEGHHGHPFPCDKMTHRAVHAAGHEPLPTLWPCHFTEEFSMDVLAGDEALVAAASTMAKISKTTGSPAHRPLGVPPLCELLGWHRKHLWGVVRRPQQPPSASGDERWGLCSTSCTALLLGAVS